MRFKKLTILVAAFVVAILCSTGVASATNGHQDHKGACSRSTTSIHKVVNDLQFNGVLGKFAKAMGIKGINGSYKFQMERRLVNARVKRSVTTVNHGCDGSGHVFPAGHRRLVKDEEVFAIRPANISQSEICSRPSPSCKEVTFKTTAVLPDSCGNLNILVTIELVIFVKKHRKPHKPKLQPTPEVVETPAKVICSNIVGSGNNNQQGGNCDTNICVGTNVCNETFTPPPPCGCEPPTLPPPPKEPEQPKVTLERIQEFETNETGEICAKVDPPAGDSVSVQFEAEYGSFIDGGKGVQKTGTDRFCNLTYKAPSQLPPRACKEPGLPSDAVWCDLVEVTVRSSNGSKPIVRTREAPIKEETPF